MGCDLCGKEGNTYRTQIEDTIMNVCSECSSFGKVLSQPRTAARKPITPQKKQEVVERVIDNFSSILKNEREKRGLNQKDFAALVNEKESLMHKIESGRILPSIKLARKLGRILGIRLIENEEIEEIEQSKSLEEGLTLGDVIKIKKK